MAEMKFNCPSCSQLIACDELWIGQEIQCPMCATALTVPSQQASANNPLVPPPPSAGSRLSIGQSRHQAATSPPPPSRIPAPVAGGKKKQKKTSSGRGKTLAIWGIILVVLGAGVFFGWPYLKEYQEKLNSKSREEAKNSDGGQVGHIANLNSVLDATEPSRPGGPRFDTGRTPRPSGASKFAGAGGAAAPGVSGSETNLPIVPTQYTLELAKAVIPEGKVNGLIAGTNFVADTVRLDPSGGAYVLRLLQGPVTAPERGIIVYLRLKAGEKLMGHTWEIAADAKGGPQVSKLYKSNPKYAAKAQNYPSGYVLKVELGEVKDGQIAGKIYVAFPDSEQSYAGGTFIAQTTVTATGAPAASAIAQPVPGTVAPTQTPAEKAAFEKRYGIRR